MNQQEATGVARLQWPLHLTAPITIDSAPVIVGTGGGALAFSGTLTNERSGTFFILGGSVNNCSMCPAGVTFNDTAFNTIAPLTLAAGESFTGNFFDLIVAALTPTSGPFSATFIVNVEDEMGNAFDIQEGFFFTVRQGGAADSGAGDADVARHRAGWLSSGRATPSETEISPAGDDANNAVTTKPVGREFHRLFQWWLNAERWRVTGMRNADCELRMIRAFSNLQSAIAHPQAARSHNAARY